MEDFLEEPMNYAGFLKGALTVCILILWYAKNVKRVSGASIYGSILRENTLSCAMSILGSLGHL